MDILHQNQPARREDRQGADRLQNIFPPGLFPLENLEVEIPRFRRYDQVDDPAHRTIEMKPLFSVQAEKTGDLVFLER